MEKNSFKFVYKQTEKFGDDPSANPHLFEVFRKWSELNFVWSKWSKINSSQVSINWKALAEKTFPEKENFFNKF